MKRLGRLLIEHGKLDPAQLDEALQCQVAFGGRLGTNLVELGYITVSELALFLSAAVGLPLAEESWLARPDPSALRAVPRALIERHRILPLKLEDRVIHVAMMDPLNPAQLDDIRFATNRRVQPYVLPELRIHYWLELHFGIRREVRYVNFGSEMERGRFTQAKAKPAAPKTPLTIIAGDPEVVEPLRAEQELLDELTFQQTYQQTSGSAVPLNPLARSVSQPGAPAAIPMLPPVEMPAPSRLDELEAQLARADNRDLIISATLSIAALLARSVAVFMVHQGLIHGLKGTGGGLDGRPMDAMILPVTAKSIFTDVAATAEPYFGPIGDLDADARLFRAMGRAEAAEIMLIPVKIRGRVVNLLYADNAKNAIGPLAQGGLLALAEQMAAAYERLILERKRPA